MNKNNNRHYNGIVILVDPFGAFFQLLGEAGVRAVTWQGVVSGDRLRALVLR